MVLTPQELERLKKLPEVARDQVLRRLAMGDRIHIEEARKILAPPPEPMATNLDTDLDETVLNSLPPSFRRVLSSMHPQSPAAAPTPIPAPAPIPVADTPPPSSSPDRPLTAILTPQERERLDKLRGSARMQVTCFLSKGDEASIEKARKLLAPPPAPPAPPPASSPPVVLTPQEQEPPEGAPRGDAYACAEIAGDGGPDLHR